MRSDPIREAIRALRAEDWHELTPVVNIHLQQPKPDSEPPQGAMSIVGPGGLRFRRAPPWLVLTLGVVAIVAGCLTYIATH